MTAVAALAFEGDVFMAADSSACDGEALYPRSDRKLFTNQEYVIGYAGSYRVGQVVKYTFIPPELPTDVGDMHRVMVTQFVPSLIACLRDGEVIEDKAPANMPGELLVGVAGQLFNIDADFHVGESQGFEAIGSGGTVARGSLMTSERISWDLQPATRLELAIAASIAFVATCGGDIHFLSTKEAGGAQR